MLKRVLRDIFILLPAFLAAAGLWSCSNDIHESELPLGGGVPVEFAFDDPASFDGTRAVNYKTLFAVDDVIHVQATFLDKDGKATTDYGAMQLNASRKWAPVEGTQLYWPFDAVTGNFKAYYIHGSTAMLAHTEGQTVTTATTNLSVITDQQDPLVAEKEGVKYGAAVNMQFTHACTHLTLEKLDQNVTDYYWMVKNGDEPILNAFRLSLDTENKLNLEFLSEPDSDYNDVVYVSRRSESMTAEEEVENEDGTTETVTRNYSKVSFYLAPGIYDSFELRTNNNFPYMSFLNSIPGDEKTGRKAGELLANHPYILDVEFAKGADFVTNTDKDWDESEGAYKVNVRDFLDAIRNNKEYTVKTDNGEDKSILRSVNGSLVLMCNIDFQNFKDYNTLGFSPDVGQGTTFDGNLHYIENIGHPIFRDNSGTIQNLGLKNFSSEVTAFEVAGDDNADFSHIGGLCLNNRTGATIRNIRMEDFNLTVKIQAEDSQEKKSNENFSIGALCGYNLSTISEISLKGKINIDVKPAGETSTDEYHYVDANINIGGIVGNHTMTLSDVGPQSGQTFSVTITNTCKGRETWGSGVFCVGGAVGLSTAKEISRVVMRNVTIEVKDSDGYQQYIGGLAGRMRGATATNIMSDCTVDGSLTCGTVSRYGTSAINPYCYVGGISGNARDYIISNCRAVCNIDSRNNSISPDATYATGGAIGMIQSGVELSDNSAYGESLYGPQQEDLENALQQGNQQGDSQDDQQQVSGNAYVGNFAGIARTSYTLAGFEAAGNTARAFAGYEMIGKFLDNSSGDNSDD